MTNVSRMGATQSVCAAQCECGAQVQTKPEPAGRRSAHALRALGLGLLVSLLAGCAAEGGTETASSDDSEAVRTTESASVLDTSLSTLDSESKSALTSLGYSSAWQLPVQTREYMVTVSPGVKVYVKEKSTVLSRLRRRGILLLTPTLVSSELYDANVTDHPEYNVMERFARAGITAFTLDYEGYGKSDAPTDGRVVTKERLLPQVGEVLEWVRRKRGIGEVDVFGMSLGADLAFKLGAVGSPIPRQHVGKVIMAASVYKSVTPLFQQVFFNDTLKTLLSSLPYIQTGVEQYGLILNAADSAAADWAYQELPGVYASGPTLEGFSLPSYPAADGRAPLLLFWGNQDLITPQADAELFAQEYGGPVDLETLDGGSHAPFLEPVKDQFWKKSLAFLNQSRSWSCPWMSTQAITAGELKLPGASSRIGVHKSEAMAY